MNKKWRRIFNGNFIDLIEPLGEKDVNKLLTEENLDRIQINQNLDRFNDTFILLNNLFFTKRPEVGFRVYGNNPEFKDLNFLKLFINLRKFSVDEFYLQDLTPIAYLSNLEELHIGEIKTNKISYAPLASLIHLKRLSINGTKKDMNTISKLDTLRVLSLRSVKLDSLDLLLPLHELTDLGIYLGGIRNFELLPKIGKIESLVLLWIRELPEKNLHPIAEMKHLKKLELNTLKHIQTMQWLQKSKSLRELALIDLNGLESLAGIENITNLEILKLGTVAKNKNIEPILKCKNLKELGIPYKWGKNKILQIHNKFPNLNLDEYLKEIESRLNKLKN